jgi:hypothetical protein
MALLLKELSILEVEPLEVIVHTPEPKQDSNLDTLTTAHNEIDFAALLTGQGAFPANTSDAKCCCCACCCPCCCVCC